MIFLWLYHRSHAADINEPTFLCLHWFRQHPSSDICHSFDELAQLLRLIDQWSKFIEIEGKGQLWVLYPQSSTTHSHRSLLRGTPDWGRLFQRLFSKKISKQINISFGVWGSLLITSNKSRLPKERAPKRVWEHSIPLKQNIYSLMVIFKSIKSEGPFVRQRQQTNNHQQQKGIICLCL